MNTNDKGTLLGVLGALLCISSWYVGIPMIVAGIAIAQRKPRLLIESRQMFPIEWQDILKNLPMTGRDFQVVNIFFQNGTHLTAIVKQYKYCNKWYEDRVNNFEDITHIELSKLKHYED